MPTSILVVGLARVLKFGPLHSVRPSLYTLKFRAGIVGVCALLIACSNSLEEVEELTKKDQVEAPFQVSEDVRETYSDEGQIQLEVVTPRMEDYREENSIRREWPLGLKILFSDSTGATVSELKAKKGVLYGETNVLVVEDSVIFKNQKGDRLDTDLLNIFLDKDSIRTDELVTVSTKNGTIAGEDGVVSNLNFTKYKLKRIRRGRVNYKEPQ